MAEVKDNEDLVNKESSSPCTYEHVIEQLGSFGKFQFIQLTLCCFSYIFCSIMSLGFVFIGYTPHHVCNGVNETEILSKYGFQNDSNAIVSYSSCHVSVSTNNSGKRVDVDSFSCPDGRNFTGGKHLTLVSQWDLVCESMGLAELGQTLFIAGQILGGFITPSIADRYGRKSVIVVCSIACIIIEFSITFAPNIYTVWGLLLIDGVSFIGFNSSAFVLGLEYLRPKHRDNFGIALCIFWVFCVLYIDLMGFIFENIGWRYFQAVGAGSGLIVLLYPFFLEESPRWLAANNRPEEALAILKKACLQNRKDFAPVQIKFREYMNCNGFQVPETKFLNEDAKRDNKKIVEKTKGMYSVLHLFHHKHTFSLLVVSWYIWITHNVAYYGIYMTSSSLSGNRFVNFSILAIVEIPSNLLVLYMLKRMGRLVIIRIFLLASALSLLASSLCTQFSKESSSFSTLSTILFIVGKFSIGSSFSTIFLHTPEIFPTVLRSTGFGTCKSISRIGSLVAPYFRPLYNKIQWAPGIIFSVMCIIALIVTPLLPETKGKILPTTIEEMCKKRQDKKRKNIILTTC